jgi:hypothetical protein
LDRARITERAGIAAEAEIVVAWKHRELVRNELKDYALPAARDGGDDDQELGLSRIAFRSDDDFRGAVEEFQKFGRRKRRVPLDDELGTDALDALLGGLRENFKDLNAGWAPLMGKNRLVGVGIGGNPGRVGGGVAIGGNPGRVGGGGGGPLKPTGRLRTRPKDAMLDQGVGVRVGVLDTQIYSNPWYAGAWTSRVSDELKVQGRQLPPAAGHATFVTGMVLQQAPAATVIARSILGDDGEATSWDVAKAIVALARTRPQVLNLSFLCFTEDGEPPLVLSTAIDKVDADTVIVAAAGNHGRPHKKHPYDPPAWPAAFNRVVAVAATDPRDAPSSFSPHGQWIDVYAPGEDVDSTFIEGELTMSESANAEDKEYSGYATWSGTSFAAAKLSGAIAARTKIGTTSPRTALDELLEQGRPVPGGADHARILDARVFERYFDPTN